MHDYRFTIAVLLCEITIVFDVGNSSASNVIVEYSANMNINAAYNKMTSNVVAILETTNANFKRLRRACIQEIHALGSTLPKALVHKIQPTESLDDMLDVLAQSPYWNWFDTRLLEALVSASGSPEAEQWLGIFKATFYAKKVTEVIPYISIKPFKESIDIMDKFDKNPKDLTISELLEHKYKLEYEVLDIDEGELVLSCIKTGCVELTWQIPQELVYRAYTSMKRKHDELSLLAVKSLVCEVADEYAGLPILWRGQEVGEVGPIEPLPEHVRQEPYSLPQGFYWVTLTNNDIEEVAKFACKCDAELHSLHFDHKFRTHFIGYYITHPSTRSEWQLGVRTTNGKLVGFILGVPKRVHIENEKIKTFIDVEVKCHKKYNNKRLRYILIKEFVRRANLAKINHLVFIQGSLFKPVSSVMQWKYQFNQLSSSYLPSSPRTPGWRRMTSKDVPSVLALINKWSSQFEIRQVFNSEEETSHEFILQKFVFTYVVEDKPNNITDLVSYNLSDASHTRVFITIVVSTQSPVKQLITDALVCARENGAKVVSVFQHNIESNILSALSFQPSERQCTFHFYNYRYHEVSQAKFCFFAFEIYFKLNAIAS